MVNDIVAASTSDRANGPGGASGPRYWTVPAVTSQEVRAAVLDGPCRYITGSEGRGTGRSLLLHHRK
jgi:hypothetical protein